MDPTNINILCHSDFLGTRFQSEETPTYKFVWWWLAIIETLLSTRLILEYFDANLTSYPTYVIYSITNYIMYPFATTFANTPKDGSYDWITIVAITGYFLLTITLIGIFKAKRSPHSKIERARTLSRRKYSR